MPACDAPSPLPRGARVATEQDGTLELVVAGPTHRRSVVAQKLGALLAAYDHAVEDTVRDALRQGLHGWPVTDCVVTLVRSGYIAPLTEAAHFRLLTPMVLMRALAAAGTRVYEPVREFELDLPEDALSAAVSGLHACAARVSGTDRTAQGWRVTGEIPVRGADAFRTRLPGISRGEGVWWTRPGGDLPVRGRPPRRARTDGNPLDPNEYLVHLGNAGRAGS